MNDVRDEELGAMLRELYAPEHRLGFHRELRDALAAERSIARRRRRRARGTIALAAAAAVAAIVAVGLPHHSAGPPAANAAFVQARLRKALDSMRNLSGVLVEDGKRWRFRLDAAGDARLEGPRAGDVVTYDASAGVARSAQHSASIGGPTIFYAERRGVAPGPPDQGPPTWILPGSFAAYVRAALAAGDPRVREITYEGRRAWRLDVPGRFEITVDRATGMPVRVVDHGRELRVEHLAVDATLPAATFRLAFRGGAEVMRSDDGFRRTTLASVTTFVPAWVPAGYRLTTVAAKGGVVSLAYRRGLDQLTVSTRPRTEGAHAGLTLTPRALPSLRMVKGARLVTIVGNASRGELRRIARSMRRS